MANGGAGNQDLNGTSEQRQRNLDHDSFDERDEHPEHVSGSPLNRGGTVIRVELEDDRPTTVKVPPEQDAGATRR
jgi:hypothetical protein